MLRSKRERVDRTNQQQRVDMIVIAVCAVLCGADSWVEIEAFGNANRAWFRTCLDVPNGIPSHDTCTQRVPGRCALGVVVRPA